MTRWWIGGLLALSLACTPLPGTRGTVASFDSRIVLQPDGDLNVTETLAVEPDASGIVGIDRVMRSATADAVTFESLAIDGISVAPGAPGVEVSPVGGRGLRVSWRAAEPRGPAVVSLAYRVERAVAVREPRGRLVWPLFLGGDALDVGTAHVVLTLPDQVSAYDGTGMAEAGWSVAITPHGVEARHPDVPAGDGATLLAVFDIDRAVVRQGEWEWNLDRQAQFLPALISGALFILVVGLGVLGLLRVQYPPVEGVEAEARAASLADRRNVARGLRVSAWVSLLLAVAGAVASDRWLAGLGPAVQTIPASVAIVAVLFLIAGWWYGRQD